MNRFPNTTAFSDRDSLLINHNFYNDTGTSSGATKKLQDSNNNRSSVLPSLARADDVSSAAKRISSVDLLRGLTVFFMMLVNNADGSYHVLGHSYWNGLTIADVVMPNFLFIVGMSVAIAFSRALKHDPKKFPVFKRTFIRVLKLFGLGLILQGSNYIPAYDLSTLRIMGVLQRIAFVYLIVSCAFLLLPRLKIKRGGKVGKILFRYLPVWLCGAALFILYIALLFGVDVPGCGRGSLEDYCNAAGYIDANVFTPAHMYPTPTCHEATPPCLYFDPEGLLTTISATGSAFIGLAFGLVLVHYKSHKMRLLCWSLPTVLFTALGLAAHFGGFPLNKNLYSTSYVLLCAGISGTLLVVSYLLVDVPDSVWPRRIVLPFIAMGMNAIILYFGDGIVPYIIGSRDAGQVAWIYYQSPTNTFAHWVYNFAFLSYIPVHAANMLWGLSDAAFWVLVACILYKLKIFIKV